MTLIKFSSANDGRDVYINPQLVRLLTPAVGDDQKTYIAFSERHGWIVIGSPDEVAARLAP